jgi:hypothetical protein
MPDVRRTRLLSRGPAVLIALGLAVAGCISEVPPSLRVPPTSTLDAVAWGSTICQAADQLSLALGDPATGDRSAAWDAFETALTSADEGRIDAAANAVLGHLTEGGRQANAARGFEPGFAAAGQWADLLDGLAVGVRTLRDGTIDGDPARIAEGRALIDAALESHYEQAFGQMRTVPLPAGALPCG